MNTMGFRQSILIFYAFFLGLGVLGAAQADDYYPRMGWGDHRGMMGYGYEQRERMQEEAQGSGQMPYGYKMGYRHMGPGAADCGGHMGPGMMGPGMMGYGGHMGGGGMGGMWAIMQLDLSDDQEKAVRDLHRKQRRENWVRMGDMMEHQDRLSELYAADTLDAKAIGKVYADIFDLKRQKIESAVQAQNEARVLLTDEQRKALKEEQRSARRYMGGYGRMR